MSELIPASMTKLSKRISAYLTSRDIMTVYPLLKHPENLSRYFRDKLLGLIRRRWRIVNEAATIYVAYAPCLPCLPTGRHKLPAHLK